MTTPTQADRDAAAAFISPSDGDFDELTELFARHREQAERKTVEDIVAWLRAGGIGQLFPALAKRLQSGEWKA